MQCHVASSYSWVFVFDNTVATCISCSLLPCDYLLCLELNSNIYHYSNLLLLFLFNHATIFFCDCDNTSHA